MGAAVHPALPCSGQWGRERRGGGRGSLQRIEERKAHLGPNPAVLRAWPPASRSTVTWGLARNVDSQVLPGPAESAAGGGSSSRVCTASSASDACYSLRTTDPAPQYSGRLKLKEKSKNAGKFDHDKGANLWV